MPTNVTAPPTGSTMEDEVTYVSGITNTGTVAAISGLTWNGDGSDSSTPDAVATYNQTMSTASKWGPSETPGTSGGTQLYYFDPASDWTPAEQSILAGGLALWSAESNIQFAVTTNRSAATLDFIRGNTGSEFETGGTAPGELIGATTLGGSQGANVSINVTTNSPASGFGPISFSSDTYPIDALIHEEGHFLGFYHGGPYNGDVNSATQQYSPYDNRLYSIMSYIDPEDTTAKYYGSYTVTGTSWNNNDPTTPQMLDILAAQRLYGAPTTTPLSGGQVFGFNTNITGLIQQFFDFTINTAPVITLFDTGTNNTLDLSGYATAEKVNLNAGTFSSFDGMVNNLGIAFATAIDNFVGGTGGTEVTTNTDADTITDTGFGNIVDFSGTLASYLLVLGGAAKVLVTSIASGITDILNGVQTLAFSDQSVQTSVLTVAPTVTLATAPTATNVVKATLGTVSAANAATASDPITVTLTSDADFSTGSSIVITGGKLIYTPGVVTAAKAGSDVIKYVVTDTTTGASVNETQTVTLGNGPAPTVILATSPSASSTATATLGTAIPGVTGDALVVTLTSDADFATGSKVTLSNGNLVYTPGTITAANAGSDALKYSVTDSVTGAVTMETQNVTLVAATTGPNPPVTIGSGPQSFVLNMSEDAYMGNAQFTVAVNGTQVGGTQTTTALHSMGQDQAFTVAGSFGTQPYTVTVDFLNDAYGGTATTDRNLYVDTTTVGGVTQNTNAALLSSGSVSFSVGSAGTSAPVTIGSGPDTLALQVSGDAYMGDPQFTVAVNGSQIGGVQTATASHLAGASQTFNVMGNFAGPGSATITFLNDAYGGTAATDVNLYETGATINGKTISGAPLTELSDGSMTFQFPGSNTTNAATSTILGLSEDAYMGDAQYTVSIDGKAASMPAFVTALHSAGASQALSLGTLTAGSHDIAVSFLNDAYGGTAATDKNLYVTGIAVNGSVVPNSTASLLGDMTTHFTVNVPH
ncbi:carbohydrate-binding domain-containing protein [Acidisphaera sp. L21]|uniref:carbohydrate-binding domain-containing protein n=1 Tax=Acidisphaera sp. L21 TaxID=1641851 RepID=UPI00131A6381|nr:carbohydrate-binding domain-containing protein [Acidisphaera sp. L21]